jgi:hypothetical protein
MAIQMLDRQVNEKRLARGAALVEAAAVMPVLVIFYGLMIMAFRERDLKQTLMAESRNRGFSSTLHQCRAVTVEAPSFGLEKVAGYTSVGTHGWVSGLIKGASMQSFVVERGNKTTTTSKGVATNAPLSNMVRTNELSATTQVYCVPLDIQQVAPPGARMAVSSMSSTTWLVDALVGALLLRVRSYI